MNESHVTQTGRMSYSRALALRSFDCIESLSARLAHVLERHGRASRAVITVLVAMLFLLSMRHGAHAAPNLLQKEIDVAFNIESGFSLFDNAISLAQYLFGTLAALTIIVNVLAYYIRSQTVQGLGQVVLSSILKLGIPFVIIAIAPTILPTISLVGLQIADSISGTPQSTYGGATNGDAPSPTDIQTVISDLYNHTFGSQNGNSNVTVSPSNIAQDGANLGFSIIDRAACARNGGTYDASKATPCSNTTSANTKQTYNSDDQIMLFIIGLAISIIGTFVFIAVELIIAYLQLYLVLPIAAFSLGFLGSPATRQYGAGYWTVVVQALLKFVTIVFVIGFAETVGQAMAAALAAAPPVPAYDQSSGMMQDVNSLKASIGLSMVAYSLLFIVRTLPALFNTLLSGGNVGADGNQAESNTANRFSTGSGGKGEFGGANRSGSGHGANVHVKPVARPVNRGGRVV